MSESRRKTKKKTNVYFLYVMIMVFILGIVAVIYFYFLGVQNEAGQKIVLTETKTQADHNIGLSEILDKYYESQGGLLAMDEVQSMQASGSMEIGEQSFDFIIYKKKPSKIRVSLKNNDNDLFSVMSYDGNIAWEQKFNSLEKTNMTSLMSEIDKAEFIRDAYIFSHLYKYEERGIELTYLGVKKIAGVNCHKIKAVLPDKSSVIYYLDTDTFYERVTISSQKYGDNIITKESVFSDIKNVGKFVVAGKVLNRVNGKLESNIIINKFDFGVGVFDNFFKYPKEENKIF